MSHNIMGKEEIYNFFLSHWEYLDFFLRGGGGGGGIFGFFYIHVY